MPMAERKRLFDDDALARYTAPDDGSLPVRQTVQPTPRRIPLGLNAPKPRGELSPAARAILIGGNALDGVTTKLALARGGHERYPFLPDNQVGNALAKSAVTGVEHYGLDRLAADHPSIANTLAIILGLVPAAAGLSNLRQLTR